MKGKIKKMTIIVVFVFFAIIVFEIFYQNFLFTQNYKFAKGEITDITKPRWKNSGDFSILYNYQVNGKIYNSDESYNLCNNLTREMVIYLLKNKKFPVAYSVKNPSIRSMIITQDNAKRFKYIIPDSLLIYDSILTCK